jgi:hypothetical protein
MTELQVECYSGHTYAQEPRAFIWQGQRYQVVRIERRWRAPEGPAFCVQVQLTSRSEAERTGDFLELWYNEGANRWAIRNQKQDPE